MVTLLKRYGNRYRRTQWLRFFFPSGRVVLLALTLGTFLFVAADSIDRATPSLAFPYRGPNSIECEPREGLFSQIPRTHYLYSKRYGWFDTAHFGTGNPAQLIKDVRTVAANGGGMVSVQQGVRDGITGYTARYWVSRRVTSEQVPGVALGIYLDWSRRFEAWQDQPPRDILGPFTPFAVEDLPSQYVGFYASMRHMDLAYVLACYLDEMAATNTAPPRLVPAEQVPGGDETTFPGLQRLVNKSFNPLVQTAKGWRHVPWPRTLRMPAISSYSGLWRFDAEETWYFEPKPALAGR